MYSLDGNGNRLYTLKKIAESGEITKSSHPARFSPVEPQSTGRDSDISGRQILSPKSYTEETIWSASYAAECVTGSHTGFANLRS